MYAYVVLDTFYSSQAGLTDQPCVVLRGTEVLCADEMAQRQGVHRGMHRTEARSLLSNAHWVDYKALDYETPQEEWLNMTLELVDQVQTHGEHACWLPMHSHAQPQDLVEALLARVGYGARAGMGSSRWLAQWASRLSAPGAVTVMPRLGPWLNELPVSALPLEAALLDRCKHLGLHTLGQLLAVPMAQLRGQFGKQSAAIMALARGYDVSVFAPDYPPNSYSCRVDLPGGTEDRLALDEALTNLGAQLAERLAEDDAEVRDVALILEWSEAAPSRHERRFARPMRRGASLTLAARMMLDHAAPQEPIWGIRLQALRTERTRSTQPAFETMQSPKDRDVHVRRAVRSLSSLFGDDALRPASAMPTTRRQRVLRAWKDAIGWQ